MPLYLPDIYEEESSRSMTANFLGLNRNLRIGDGEWYDMQNLTSDHAPVMEVRKRRGIPAIGATKPVCITTRSTGDAGTYQPVWLDGAMLHNGTDKVIDLTPYGFVDNGVERQMVNMGAYLIIVPDMIYVNTAKDDDVGMIEDKVTLTEGTLTAVVCDYEGNLPTYSVNWDKSELINGDTVLFTAGQAGLYRYDESTGELYRIQSYLRISVRISNAPGSMVTPITMRKQILAGDSLRLSGAAIENEDKIKGMRHVYGVNEYAKPGDVESSGVLNFWTEGFVNSIDGIKIELSEASPLTIERVIPRMDFVCEAGNRLWGCRYGDDGQGNFVNEIYCSARGDFYRWIAGQSDNDDSPVTFSIGTDGAWTGAINYDGYPTFFKERCMHRVGGYGASGFTVQDNSCMGVARGAHRSMAVIKNVLYYKAESAVMGFDGTIPVPVSDALGRLAGYTRAVGGACGAKYYLSLWKKSGDATTDKHLYVLDTDKGVWHREDDSECESMAAAGDNMYFVRVDRKTDVTHTIMTVEPLEGAGESQKEGWRMAWYAESGIIGLETPDAKYLTKIAIRLRLEQGASVRVSVQYDSMGEYQQVMATEGIQMKTVTFPVQPTMFDHMRIRLDGIGRAQVFSITKTFERAEDR